MIKKNLDKLDRRSKRKPPIPYTKIVPNKKKISKDKGFEDEFY